MDRLRLLEELLDISRTIRSTHAPLFDPALDVVPIPFFGRLDRARVLTVGLNPSNGESRAGDWPREITASALDEKLLAYFEPGIGTPYVWFETWERALESAGVSYADGSAAHVDLSPPYQSVPTSGDGRVFRDAGVPEGHRDFEGHRARSVNLSVQRRWVRLRSECQRPRAVRDYSMFIQT
jgi:hypothetical protein